MTLDSSWISKLLKIFNIFFFLLWIYCSDLSCIISLLIIRMRDMREVKNSIYQCTFFLFKRSRLMTQAFIIPTNINSISVCCFELFEIVITLLYYYSICILTCSTFYKLICVVCNDESALFNHTFRRRYIIIVVDVVHTKRIVFIISREFCVVEIYMENMHTNNKQGNSLRK